MDVLDHISGNKIRQDGNSVSLLIDINNIEESIAFYNSNSMDAIELNYVYYLVPQNLDFLDSFIGLKALTIISDEEIDISNLIAVKSSLEHLSINRPFSQKLDLSLFEKLNYLYIHWNNNIILDKPLPIIEVLKVNSYKKKEFEEIRYLPNLKRLEIYSSSIKSLNALEHLSSLEFLGAYYLRGIEALDGLSNLKNIKTIDIQNCSKIIDLTPLSSLSELKELTINSCKDINSLKPLQNLKKLKTISLLDNTKVLDGDMSFLLGLEFVAYENRRHYSHTNEEIDKINGWKEN